MINEFPGFFIHFSKSETVPYQIWTDLHHNQTRQGLGHKPDEERPSSSSLSRVSWTVRRWEFYCFKMSPFVKSTRCLLMIASYTLCSKILSEIIINEKPLRWFIVYTCRSAFKTINRFVNNQTVLTNHSILYKHSRKYFAWV